jgi:hypothetical protein
MSDSEDEKPKKQVSTEFVQHVRTYLEIDDKIREIRDKTKQLTKDKKQHEDYILIYLKAIEEEIVDVKDGKLKRNVIKKQEPLKKANIQKALAEILQDANKATTITEQIIKSRPTVEKVTLRRTKNKFQEHFIQQE